MQEINMYNHFRGYFINLLKHLICSKIFCIKQNKKIVLLTFTSHTPTIKVLFLVCFYCILFSILFISFTEPNWLQSFRILELVRGNYVGISGSNTKGSFTTAVSNSILSSLGKNLIAAYLK